MTTARYTKKDRMLDFYRRFADLGFERHETDTLRRAEMTLSRWAERECGDGSNWAIERDEETGKPFNVYHGEGKPRRYAIADREKGALRRIDALMAAHPELIAYHQGDPRGCALYVVRKADVPEGESVDRFYTRGFACNY